MSEFATTASLEVVVDDASLRSANQTIQQGIDPLQTDGGTASQSIATSAIEKHGERRSKEAALARQLQSDQLEIQKNIWETLDDLADTMGEGGFLGGGIGELLVETGAETAGGAAGEFVGSVPGILSDMLGPALGTILGDVVSTYLPGDGASTTVNLTKPEWVPIKVENPGDVDVDVDVSKPDWRVGVKEPGWQVDVDEPDWEVAVDDPSPLQVEDVDPIPVDIPEMGSSDTSVSVSVTNGSTRGQTRRDYSLGDRVRGGLNDIPVIGEDLANFDAGVNRKFYELFGKDPNEVRIPGRNDSESTQSTSGGATTEVNVTVNQGDIVIEDVELRRLRRELERERQQQIDDAMGRLERKLTR